MEIFNIVDSDLEGIEKLEERIIFNSNFGGIKLSIKHYRDLKVWQKAYQLCLEVYRLTREFPKEERYGLTSQVRRASVSIVSNIAEGYGRGTTAEYIRGNYISYGSLCELETQILLCCDLGYINKEKAQELQGNVREVERMLKSLITALEKKISSP